MVQFLNIILIVIIGIVFGSIPFIIDIKYSEKISYKKILPAFIPASILIIDTKIIFFFSEILTFIYHGLLRYPMTNEDWAISWCTLSCSDYITPLIWFSIILIIRYLILKFTHKNLKYKMVSFYYIFIILSIYTILFFI